MPDFPNMIDRYVFRACEAIHNAEKTEVTYKNITEEYETKHGKGVTADYAAADDPRLRQAIGDGAWYRDKARTYALGAIALMLHEQRQEKKR
jgi:hypothetical protein